MDILMRGARGYNVAGAVGLGVAATATVATIVAASSGMGGRYPLVATLFCAGFLAIVVGAAGHRHPFPRFGAANCVTTARVALAALLAGLIGEAGSAGLLWPAIWVVVLASALDGADGWLARRTRLASAFGAFYDMETDAALILVLSVLVWQHEKAGGWVLMCGLMRYAFVVAGWLLPWLAGPLRSTRRGKTVAVMQYVGLGVALAPIVPPRVASAVAAATLAALTWSFARDVRWLWREADVRRSGQCG
jgi:phosphatidylglycerophosphate synthase